MSEVQAGKASSHPALHLYLDLLKRSLINEIGIENELRIAYLQECLSSKRTPDELVLHDIRRKRRRAYDAFLDARMTGRFVPPGDGPGYAHTMIGRARLDHMEECLDALERDRIAGDLMEAGIWRGGVGIFMRGYLAAHDIRNRAIWLADSFEGLPPTGLAGVPVDPVLNCHLAIDAETVREGFARFGLWDDRVHLVEGWFADTLRGLAATPLALLRLDGDLFQSTLDALVSLYPRVASGGFIVIDDYHAVAECRVAVDAYRLRHGIETPLERVDWACVAWRKP